MKYSVVEDGRAGYDDLTNVSEFHTLDEAISYTKKLFDMNKRQIDMVLEEDTDTL